MKMLQMRQGRKRNDGSVAVVPLVREKHRKYGQVVSEKALSVRRDVLVTGAHSSGKSRWLDRYQQHGTGIWPNNPIVLLRAVNPLMSWYDTPQIKASVGEDVWKTLSAYQRCEALVSYINDKSCVLLLDDAHKLVGRKADLVLRCIPGARVIVTTASDGVRIPLTLRLALMKRNPQAVQLASDAPYDVTALVVWLATLISLGSGAYLIAALLGGVNLLGRGARAAKNA